MTSPLYPEVSTFVEAVALIGNRFCCVVPDISQTPAIAPTGEPYIELRNGQRRAEGGTYPVAAFDEKAAAQIFLDGVLRLGSGKSTLYWRVEPEISESNVLYDEVSGVTGVPGPVYRPIKLYLTYCRLAFE